ncbi:partner of Y14 and mago isoform X2 [Selaginella moellendorffii]|uniref:partner of Y14 and mago isoform X2 n=1 Tax=Selaginella moellendorffii TaxID=88036 RepID=UPI000D1CF523|nr:partner of Y14 and mago isoform X2 [Selaginella moellendorffii]XP_024529159.1 partner of Y14 and mago isoform X2 [Selaginella moellendorffii]|eukprot:XP_024527809.1 partner of Y14 and mago isoform X2 [Selaginella moellendorffii]
MMGSEAKGGEERILPATRRPDGTMRKAVRIRAGYVAQEEVAIYQSKGALFKKDAPLVPPGYDPETDLIKPKTKAAKKNEKRKEKKQQAKLGSTTTEPGDSLSQKLDALQVSSEPCETTKQGEISQEGNQSVTDTGKSELEKRIRALKKRSG